MESTPLQQRLNAMRQRIQDRQTHRDATTRRDVQRLLTRLDDDIEAKVQHARSVIRHGDFSDAGYLVTNGLVDF